MVQECSLFSTPSPAFIFCRLFDDGHSDWCEMISHCSFDLHFSNKDHVEHLFMCLLAIYMSSLEKCLFRSFPHFLRLGCFFFRYWVVWAACILWKLILCLLFRLLLFYPILRVFHLANSFVCCAKAFVFISVTLGGGSQRILLWFMSSSVLPMFSSKS